MPLVFLETGNGNVVVNGISPQPIGGIKQSTAVGPTVLMTLYLPRTAQGVLIPGTYSGEYLLQAYDIVTGDVFSHLVQVVVKHFASVTTLVASNSVALTRTGTLVAAADGNVINVNGDLDITFDPTTANAVNQSGMGVFLTV